MHYFDVFNGDADGICALVQLRLSAPRESVLITGVKRDIALLDQVTAKAGDNVTVLDLSMQKNLPALNNLLAAGVEVFYADHHQSGEIPQHENLKALIDLSPTTCT
ncbi:MAG TPA: acetyltransferase, partial [Methylotenera sp.]|nr:acetyltransferase [Methylotenera sp.]